jgi:hypothetical protein
MKNVLGQNPLREVRRIEVRPGYATQRVSIDPRIRFVLSARGLRICHHRGGVLVLSRSQRAHHKSRLLLLGATLRPLKKSETGRVGPGLANSDRGSPTFSRDQLASLQFRQRLPTWTGAIREPMGTLADSKQLRVESHSK